MKSHDELMNQLLSSPETKAAYDEMEKQFGLVEKLIVARLKAGISQSQVAESMGTKTPAISRLESCKHSPTWSTLVSYAEAIGCRLDVTVSPLHSVKTSALREPAGVVDNLRQLRPSRTDGRVPEITPPNSVRTRAASKSTGSKKKATACAGLGKKVAGAGLKKKTVKAKTAAAKKVTRP